MHVFILSATSTAVLGTGSFSVRKPRFLPAGIAWHWHGAALGQGPWSRAGSEVRSKAGRIKGNDTKGTPA